jgi:hypothetical protein
MNALLWFVGVRSDWNDAFLQQRQPGYNKGPGFRRGLVCLQ